MTGKKSSGFSNKARAVEINTYIYNGLNNE